ncbi:MarR family winged helix-turn-helix transcriptional regulator [Amycolatopsis benzoatilytica]|uniref:MarR family winged helix-turn-helix transcriptional regulator n=1 Tax=Amycolatopsis benzoatilytica TaxID=346045 RepID=UPI00036ED49F|nr:MarR family transcriptional regulator [Amycolatopsis benzoatilytica]
MAADERLFFLLQSAAHRLRVDGDRRCLAAAGVTTAQLGALLAVHDQPGLTQRALAAELGQRESAVTPMIGRLTEAGLISRQPHPEQHRALVLNLTEEGNSAIARLRPVIAQFNRELRALLGDAFGPTSQALKDLARWP